MKKDSEKPRRDDATTKPNFPGNYALRPRVAGKFLFLGTQKFWIKGVTYGTFSPDAHGDQFPDKETVAADFALMSARGFNTVRVYTVPPLWLLDAAQAQDLRVMVGLPWEQHVTFLDDPAITSRIEKSVKLGVSACAKHPAILCYSIGNEIPVSIVRWNGRRRIQQFLKRLYKIAKGADPEALVTYVNFPTTEFLQLPFLDFQCFNVYLESKTVLANYLARLQNLVQEQPLVMAEIGLDSRSHGEEAQAESLDWQVRTSFAEGCAGAMLFAWTDEWHRGGHDIDDWDFGLTRRNREPKPALAAVEDAFAEVPFPADLEWPRVSIVVCSLNGAATIRDTMEGLKHLDYPNYEVIVVDDGSTDETPDIVSEYDVVLISTENRGLSAARNTGWQEANGEIVAYIDDDAYPDPHWMQYIAHTFMTTDFVGVGGPNLAPEGDGPIAECVYNSPGGPVQVLLDDREAEHIPGCNMVFRREALAAIDGFDVRYRAAGDDVDLCWRLQQQVGKIGFHAAAMDWHYRRNSIKLYWKQQLGYGKAEALLEEKWPEKYNALGHYSWSGRLYGSGITASLLFGRSRIYGGKGGSALFQSLYEPAAGLFASLPLMPEWYIVIAFLCLLSIAGLAWAPLLWVLPLLILAVAAPVCQALISGFRAVFPTQRMSPTTQLKLRGITAMLHLMQPLARLTGRLQHGLTPWRDRPPPHPRLASPKAVWREEWRDPADTLAQLMTELRNMGAIAAYGGDYDNWDLAARGGLLGGARLRMAVEEHGAGRQLYRFRIYASIQPVAILFTLGLGTLAVAAAFDGAWLASVVTGVLATSFAMRASTDGLNAAAAMGAAVGRLE